jgi:hypothetical protein
MDFQTPDSIIQELKTIRSESSKGVDALFEAERELAEAELAFDTVHSKALLANQGTALDRQALASLAAADARFERDLARARVSRIKVKLKVLSEQQMSVQTQARMVELTWRTS